jgi:hypothetical protein
MNFIDYQGFDEKVSYRSLWKKGSPTWRVSLIQAVQPGVGTGINSPSVLNHLLNVNGLYVA